MPQWKRKLVLICPHCRDWVNADDGNRGFCPVCQGEISDPDETTHKRAFLKPYAHVRIDLLYAKMDFKRGISGFTLEEEDMAWAELSLCLSTGSYPVEYGDTDGTYYIWIPHGEFEELAKSDLEELNLGEDGE